VDRAALKQLNRLCFHREKHRSGPLRVRNGARRLRVSGMSPKQSAKLADQGSAVAIAVLLMLVQTMLWVYGAQPAVPVSAAGRVESKACEVSADALKATLGHLANPQRGAGKD
jgi:hypothetical protein